MDRRKLIPTKWFGIILILALAVRIGAFSLIAGQTPKYYSNPDAYEYEKIAINLLRYGIFADGTRPPLTSNIYRTPVYPAVMASIYAGTNKSPTAVVLIRY